jgi:DNA repair exonuclease SbcCD ATPase subunit
MGNEKYLNYYIETLTSTVTDCVIRNVSMQANAKVTDEVIKEQVEKIESLLESNAELKKTIQDLKNLNSTNENAVVQDLKNKLGESEKLATNLRNDINEMTTKYRDYDSIKNQSIHVETFKSELIKAREETNKVRAELETKINSLVSENAGKISALTEQHDKDIARLTEQHDKKVNELTDKIDYLQLPPAKRKKIDELNKQIEPAIVTDSAELSSPIKDGGSF